MTIWSLLSTPPVFQKKYSSERCAASCPRDAMHSADSAVAKRLSVRLSVRHTPVFCRNGSTYHQTFFTVGHTHHSSFCSTKHYGNILTGTPLTGALNAGRVFKKSRFLTNISPYLKKDTRYGYSYYRRRIGNRTQAFEWYHFQWLCAILNPDFKVTILLNVKQLENDTG